jgi:late competence protein required for DNA uptake (superfamily II DNA/RNA helicase)
MQAISNDTGRKNICIKCIDMKNKKSNKKCISCKHFNLEPSKWLDRGYGYCRNPIVFGGDSPAIIQIDPNGVEVRSDFGCIYFKGITNKQNNVR